MRLEFQRALSAAEERRDPSGRISVIKQAVFNELKAIDPTVQVRFTDYFNHTIAPDIVLQWPHESRRERFLFVRLQSTPEWLLNDLPFVAPHRPLVFTLGDLDIHTRGKSSGTARASLETESIAAGTWITDSSGTEAMSKSRAQGVALGLLGQAMVRGGKGVSDGNDIAALTTDTEAGFTEAGSPSSLNVTSAADTIRSAVETIESHLDDAQSGRLIRLLRAVWEGHGGDSALFPKTRDIGRLTADDLSYLLKSATEASVGFWYRIGRTLTTELLGQIRVEDPSASLQALVAGNLESLQAKGIRLRHEPFHVDEPEQQVPRWRVDRGCLTMRGLNWTAYIAAQTKEEFPSPDPISQVEVPDLETLRSRAAASVPITRIQFGRDDRAFTYESKDGRTILDVPELDAAVADLGVTEVSEATARLPGGGSVEIDFPTRTGAGPTNSRLPLGSLMRSILPLLGEFPSGELTELRSVLTDRLNPELPLVWGSTEPDKS
jgi:hypothetical protein